MSWINNSPRILGKNPKAFYKPALKVQFDYKFTKFENQTFDEDKEKEYSQLDRWINAGFF